MNLEQLQNYYVGQKFVIQCDSFLITEVFDMIITDIDVDGTIRVVLRYLESPMNKNGIEHVCYDQETLDDIIRACWYQEDGWGFIGWLPIKPLNQLPEELFHV